MKHTLKKGVVSIKMVFKGKGLGAYTKEGIQGHSNTKSLGR